MQAYTKYQANNNPQGLIGTLQVLDHQYMTIFVDDMIHTLKTVGLNMGYQENSPQLFDSYLKDLVWSGSLEETTLFGTTFIFAEQERIHYRGLAELKNMDFTYQFYDENGIPNAITIQPQSNVINNSNSPCFPN
ncbi:hypothetical protein [Kordia jejudonensis]|uniref:hypothetical protein n=1 Tax=Kordia jejudonensis TaxID=1348245 RepID=UPI000629891A|nr:hypothetical protein [Kordia jejudonensis]